MFGAKADLDAFTLTRAHQAAMKRNAAAMKEAFGE